MSGSLGGGKQAADTIKKRFGEDYYKKMGRKGGKLSRGGGFASQRKGKDGLTGIERAKLVGKIGGHISRRGSNK